MQYGHEGYTGPTGYTGPAGLGTNGYTGYPGGGFTGPDIKRRSIEIDETFYVKPKTTRYVLVPRWLFYFLIALTVIQSVMFIILLMNKNL